MIEAIAPAVTSLRQVATRAAIVGEAVARRFPDRASTRSIITPPRGGKTLPRPKPAVCNTAFHLSPLCGERGGEGATVYGTKISLTFDAEPPGFGPPAIT